MPAKFSTLLRQEKAYQDLTKRRKFSYRETALEFVAVALAEREIAKLQKKLVEANANVQLEQQRTRFALLLSRTGAVLQESVRLLFTPFDDMGQKPVALLSAAPATDEDKTASNVAAQAMSIETPEAETVASERTRTSKLLDLLPKQVQTAALLCASYLGRLSPVTTVILLALVVTGSYSYAEHRYGSIEASYKNATDELSRLRAQRADFVATQDANSQLREQVASTGRRIAALEEARTTDGQQIEALERDLENSKAEAAAGYQALVTQHQSELNALREGLDAATRAQLGKYETRIAELEREREELRASQTDLRLKLQGSENQVANRTAENRRLEEAKASADRALASTNQRVRELEDIETKFRSVLSFVIDVLHLTDEHLVESNTRYMTNNRETFREQYRLVYRQARELFRELGFREF